jgi:branched-chain amino acid transport system substrate-binding protein
VAIVDADGKFRIVREASSPVIPSPYLIQLEDPVALSHAAFAKSSLS